MNTETNYAENCYSSISNDIGALKRNAKEYPFSSLANFLLLYHSKKTNDPSFDQLAKQSAIYFNNIPWIQYQLTGIGGNNIASEKTSILTNKKESESVETGQSIILSEIQGITSSANEQVIGDTDQHIKYETQTLGVSLENQIAGKEESDETFAVANEQISQNPNQHIKYETQTLGVSLENQIAGKDESHETFPVANEQISQNPVHHIKYETQTLGVSLENRIDSKEESHETFPVANEQISQNPHQDSEIDGELISFEPLHTVDYFASQGIKISEESLENDHLGQQVKSFTAWLKSMKKLHPGQLPEQNEVIEKIIQSSAEVSNQSANVLTEAMAEVLIKQGKQEKAIEMYEKLSLMNPSKSAYFAAKIESLKTI
jgi:hypothetical protein